MFLFYFSLKLKNIKKQLRKYENTTLQIDFIFPDFRTGTPKLKIK